MIVIASLLLSCLLIFFNIQFLSNLNRSWLSKSIKKSKCNYINIQKTSHLLTQFISINDQSFLNSRINLEKAISQTILITTVQLFLYFLFSKKLFLISCILTPITVFIYFKIQIRNNKNFYIENLDHIINCLNILTVKSENSLSQALETISSSLPENFFVIKKEIQKILNHSEKFGMLQSLLELEKDSVEEQEFVDILINIHKGTNKIALKKNLFDFIAKQKFTKEERRKNSANNMQLYLILPVTLMLLISLFPMIDMVLFTMQQKLNF